MRSIKYTQQEEEIEQHVYRIWFIMTIFFNAGRFTAYAMHEKNTFKAGEIKIVIHKASTDALFVIVSMLLPIRDKYLA